MCDDDDDDGMRRLQTASRDFVAMTQSAERPLRRTDEIKEANGHILRRQTPGRPIVQQSTAVLQKWAERREMLGGTSRHRRISRNQ